MLKFKHILKSIILERKQVGTLYHWTDMMNLMYIYDSNKLKYGEAKEINPYTGKKEPFISLTRDKKFDRFRRPGVRTEIAIILNGNKISDKYKIRPYAFDFEKDNLEDIPLQVKDEMEERVFTKEISPLKKYMEGIYVPTKTQDTWEKYFFNYLHTILKKAKLDKKYILAINTALQKNYNPSENKILEKIAKEVYLKDMLTQNIVKAIFYEYMLKSFKILFGNVVLQ